MYEDGISVIIPVYNSENTIERCLSSICNQTYEKLQIICVDDGSTDASLKLLEKCSEADPRIEIYSQCNSGPSKARNVGISYAQKKYITFVDSDDEIDEEMYSKMVNFLLVNQLDCVACDMLNQYINGPTSYLSLGTSKSIIRGNVDISEYLVKPLIGLKKQNNGCLPSMVNKVFLTNIIKEKGIWINEQRSYGEDWEFFIHYCRFINSIGFIYEPFYHYIHWHNLSQITKIQSNYLEMKLDSYTKFRKWFPFEEWDSIEQKKDFLNLPVRAAEYYRIHLNGKLCKEELDRLYSICMSNGIYTKLATQHLPWKQFLADKDMFDSYIWRNSSKIVQIHKIKKLTKRILTVCKLKKI